MNANTEKTEVNTTECGISFHVKAQSALGRLYRIQFWDVLLPEQFHHQVQTLCKGAAGYIFVFDITNRASFEETQRLMGLFANTSAVVKKILVGNKADLKDQRRVSEEEAQALVEANRANGVEHYFETSAVSGENVYEAFTQLSTAIFTSIPKHPDPDLLLHRGIRLGRRWYGQQTEEFARHGFGVGDVASTVDWL